jgi:hypothetical protein
MFSVLLGLGPRDRSLAIGVGAAALLTSVLAAARPSPQSTGLLARAAAHARQAGRSSETLTLSDGGGDLAVGLPDVLKVYSVVVATPVRGSDSPVAVTADNIYTWHVLRVDQTLTRRTPGPAECGEEVPGRPALKAGEMAVPVLGGTTVIDGISITILAPGLEVTLDSGSSYLLIGSRCQDGVLRLPHGGLDTFAVMPDGRFSQSGESSTAFRRAVFASGSVGAITDLIRQLGGFNSVAGGLR